MKNLTIGFVLGILFILIIMAFSQHVNTQKLQTPAWKEIDSTEAAHFFIDKNNILSRNNKKLYWVKTIMPLDGKKPYKGLYTCIEDCKNHLTNCPTEFITRNGRALVLNAPLEKSIPVQPEGLPYKRHNMICK